MYRRVREMERLEQKIRPLLAGHPPDIQGAVLAALTATWVAGHVVMDDRDKTLEIHAAIVERHGEAVRELAAIELAARYPGPD